MPVETPPTPRFTGALEEELRERATRRRRRRLPSARPVIALAAVLLALAFIVLPGSDEADQQASPPPEPFTVTREQLLSGDRELYRRLEARFAAVGEKLIVREKPVAPGADVAGKVFSLQTSVPIEKQDEPIVVEEMTGPVIVVLAVADPSEKLAGLPICETVPKLKRLVDVDDPDATARRMRGAGFDVEVNTVPWDRPGDQDVVIGIYAKGRATGVDPDTRRFTLEVGSPGDGHSGMSC